MKFNQFKLTFFLFSIILLSSCLGTTSSVTTSSDPSFVSLTFAANDSIPYLSTAKFTLDADGMTIVNVDSLPYKTRVDSVYPTFSFTSTAGAKFYFPLSGYKYKKDSAIVTGKDTIDFRQIVRIKNYATDAKTYKNYYVKVNVHKVDPEVYVWNKVPMDLNSGNATSQKTIVLNDSTMFYYFNDGTNVTSYKSLDGSSWAGTTVTGLPVNTPLGDMTQFNRKLYLTQDGFNIYSSSDGLSWSKSTVSVFTFKSLLFTLNGQLWAVVQLVSDSSLHFAYSADGNAWNVTGTIPDNFPVRDFASVSFPSITGKTGAVVLGGFSPTGAVLHNSWSTEDGLYWVDFSSENHTLDTLAIGASVISYDNKLLVFGRRTDNGMTHYKISKDQGLSWKTADTLRNRLPSGYLPRSYQTAVVFKPRTYNTLDSKDVITESNRIFIIGGKSGSTVYSDIWTGKLNRKSFLIQ
ncbi:MAG: DUF6242 domain-containing protein [Paludibacter sp.]|nr:DUF6242 domain-containing protein [Paludibacter sp.]